MVAVAGPVSIDGREASRMRVWATGMRRWLLPIGFAAALAAQSLVSGLAHAPSFRPPATAIAGARAQAAMLSAPAANPASRATPVKDPSVEATLESPPDYRLSQTPVNVGALPLDGISRSINEANALAALTQQQAPDVAGLQWNLTGPTNIGGRIVDVAPDPTAAGTVFAAAAGGGVWKSTDGGATMTSSWPATLTQAMGALAAAPNGTLYAGTGEANPGGGSVTYGGTGIYRSTDHGASWQLVGLPNSYAFGKIAVDPTNSNRVFAAAAGNLFVPGGERGLYRSLDGGNTWSLVLPGVNATTGAVDVVIDPNNPQRVWAAMWDHLRVPSLRTYGGLGSGLFLSTDGGATWTDKTLLLDPAMNRSDVGRIGVAVAPSDSNRVYAIVIRTFGQFMGFFSSTNGGASTTWTKTVPSTLSSSQTSYGWWFGRLTVDPANAQRVFAGGVSLSVTADGGATWSNVTTGHADHHSVVFDPTTAGHVYMGNDGGVEHSADSGMTWTRATVQPYTQFYSVDVSQSDATRLVGGAQDNGSNRSYTGVGGGTSSGWNSYVGGDGTETVINPQNQEIVFGCSQYGSCTEFLTGGDGAGVPISGTTSSRHNWFSPIVLDPVNPITVIYYAGNQLNQSTDGGLTWSAISPDLTGNPTVTDPFYPNYGTITTVGPAPMASKVIVVGTDTGYIQYTHDGGATWTKSTDPHLPGAWVTRVVADPADPNVSYATFSAFRTGGHVPYVMRSGDGGVTWSDISGNLPQATVNDIQVIGGELVVATDVGVYLTKNGGAGWYKVGTGLPLAPIDMIRYQPATQQLFAASFGRGMWSVALAVPTPDVPEAPLVPLFLLGAGMATAAATRFTRGRRNH